jgi:hypothetical protein
MGWVRRADARTGRTRSWHWRRGSLCGPVWHNICSPLGKILKIVPIKALNEPFTAFSLTSFQMRQNLLFCYYYAMYYVVRSGIIFMRLRKNLVAAMVPDSNQ